MYVDTHSHLTDEKFKEDADRVVEEASQNGTKFIITSGFDLNSSKKALEFALKHKNVFASVGIYPEFADQINEKSLLALKGLAKNNKVVAIGEIGFQFTEGTPRIEAQEKAFLEQLKLANELQKPIIIHCRDAIGHLINFLIKNKNLLTYGGTVHCFSGSEDSAKKLINLGLFLSVGGVSTFKNGINIRNVLKKIPLNRILLETDSPYLTPHPYRGQRNSPSFIPIIAENLANIKELSVEEVAFVTTKNALKLFNLGDKDA